MQAVYLERLDPSRNVARFYQVDIRPTLFGEWAVVAQWGRIGTYGRTHEDWFASLTDADAARQRRVSRKRRRGYMQ